MTTLQVDLDQPLADHPLVVEPPAEPYDTECTITGRPNDSCSASRPPIDVFAE